MRALPSAIFGEWVRMPLRIPALDFLFRRWDNIKKKSKKIKTFRNRNRNQEKERAGHPPSTMMGTETSQAEDSRYVRLLKQFGEAWDGCMGD